MKAMKTRTSQKKVETIFQTADLDPLAGVNNTLYWGLMLLLALANACTLLQIVTAK
jgi:hypothetical protein